MSLDLTGSRIPDELRLTAKIERLRLNETHQSTPSVGSPCRPPGKLQLRANLTGCAENLAGHRKDFTGRVREITGHHSQLTGCVYHDHHHHDGESGGDQFYGHGANGRVSRPFHPCRAGQGRGPG